MNEKQIAPHILTYNQITPYEDTPDPDRDPDPAPAPSSRNLGSLGIKFGGHRIICCNQHKEHEPYLACHEITSVPGGRDGKWAYYTVRMCGNLMHPSCIKKYGKCHSDAHMKPFRSGSLNQPNQTQTKPKKDSYDN